MKVLSKLSDKMLSAFLPRTEAGACVPEHGSKSYPSCYCSSDNRLYRRTCTIGCTGHPTCGSCYRTQNIC
ncbi:hypothetical protein AB0I28_24720 [Phytomonospora sp. NPDC050363]|uniref:hypothetical protein n=1 Tax=Phytomonospora sp. NPDC050363 TaxID=3155642 RepID=UPI0033C8F3E0